MIYVVQLFLFCGLFTALVAVGTGGRAINEIYFYPKPVQERAVELGLATLDWQLSLSMLHTDSKICAFVNTRPGLAAR